MSDPTYKPMLGYGTGSGDGPPILAYDSDNPVCMLSPCPYAQFEPVNPSGWFRTNGGAVSFPGGLAARLTLDGASNLSLLGASVVFGTVMMLYDGTAQYTAELSWHTAAAVITSAYFSTFVVPGPSPAGFTSLQSSYSSGTSNWGTLTVPYYRYRLSYHGQLSFNRSNDHPWFQVGDWVQVTLVPVIP